MTVIAAVLGFGLVMSFWIILKITRSNEELREELLEEQKSYSDVRWKYINAEHRLAWAKQLTEIRREKMLAQEAELNIARMALEYSHMQNDILMGQLEMVLKAEPGRFSDISTEVGLNGVVYTFGGGSRGEQPGDYTYHSEFHLIAPQEDNSCSREHSSSLPAEPSVSSPEVSSAWPSGSTPTTNERSID